jgi:AcrR family transcriptional regulator
MKREQQILNAAEDLFYERGFDATSVDAIGERAGITGGAIYRHFGGKDEILAVLIDHAIDAVLERLPTVADDPEVELHSLVQAHVEFAVTHPKLAGIWTRDQRSLSASSKRNYLRRERRYAERWRTVLARCYPEVSEEQIGVAMRAIHALMLSDSVRPARGRSTKIAQVLLVEMTMRSLEALRPDVDQAE